MKPIFFLCVLGLLVMSCGATPQTKQFPYVPPEIPIRNQTQSAQKGEGLPSSATVDLRRMPYLTNAFKGLPPLSRGGIDEIYATTRGKVDNIAIVSGGSLDILKAFIAKGWAPIVVIQLQNRKQQLMPAVRYDEQAREISLQYPTNFSERRLSYDDFETSWRTGSRFKCALITPQKLTEAKVKEVLGTYLQTKMFQEIGVRSR